MRVASRVIGVVLALSGLAFLVLGLLAWIHFFNRTSVLENRGPTATEWAAIGFCAVFGAGLMLLAWHSLRTDPDREDSPKSPSRADLYIAAHRRELGILALTGFVISVAHLGAMSFGVGWPGGMARWLGWLSIPLILVCPRPNWSAHPGAKVLLHAGQVAFLILAAKFAWNQWHHESSSAVVESGFGALLFGWAALSFAYGYGDDAKNGAETQLGR